MRRAIAVACAVALLCAGCGSRAHSRVALQVTVTRYVFEQGKAPHRLTKRYALECEPAGGTLPLAARVCSDIARHRQAMLAPRKERSVCAGGPFMPVLQVSVHRGGADSGFSGSPGCEWPGGTPLTIYFAASSGDPRMLTRAESLLRCEDDPSLFTKPTPYASAVACLHGLWTTQAERAIRNAESSPAIAPFEPRTLFPSDPGVRRCRIHAGGPYPGQLFQGRCGVRLTGPASAKTVHFVEAWSIQGRVFRHHWIVRGATLIAQDGAPPPQAWS